VKGKLVLPNILGIAAGVVMAVAVRTPWWIITKQDTMEDTWVYPNIIRGPITEAIGYSRTEQMKYLMAALVIGIVLCLLGSFLSRWKGRLTLLLAGVLGCLVLWRFIVRITDMASRFDMPLNGQGTLYYSGFDVMGVANRFGQGIYLMAAASGLAVLAALLHGWLRRPK
jgi:hypothetical protein